jgi:regulator of cell morphogenesis and NO signaling
VTQHAETLAGLVAEDASRARALDRLGLDYCCHGEETLEHACAHAGIDPDEVHAALAAATPTDDDHQCADLAPDALIAHLLSAHHAYLHRELPELRQLADQVVRAHGERHPELMRVRALVGEIADDLEPHMLKEERVLFPSILELAAGPAEFPFGSIRNPIAVMGVEHERAGELLAELRAVANDYEVPADGCARYGSLYERLRELEHDTHVHVFEENTLLFPRVIALEVPAQ